MSDRTRLLVDPKVQWSIAGRVFLHWLLFFICITAISSMVRMFSAVGEQPFAEAVRSALIAQIPIVGVMLMLLPVFLRDTLKLSNRFAGPMYRLRTALQGLKEARAVEPIKFRTGDFWQEAAADFNFLLQEIKQLRSENESLKSQLSEIGQSIEV